MSLLTAYYDLARNPPTWNFTEFLLGAEACRIRCGLERIAVKVLPGPVDGFRFDDLPPYGAAARERWLANICLPMPVQLPSCGEPAERVMHEHQADGPEWGRGQYTVGLARCVEAAKANVYPFAAPAHLVEQNRQRYGRYVTISIRNPGYYPERTSNREAWLEAAEAIEAMGFRVVFIPDGCEPHEPFGRFQIEPAAALTSNHRAALYCGAEMNLGINSGPMMFAWFTGRPCLMFVKLNENEPVSGAASYVDAGLPPGSQFANARPGQRLIWAPDTAAAITEAVAETPALA